jgi:peptide subunit release factor RF-3
MRASASRCARRAYRFFGRDRETISVAYAGDILGLVNPGQFTIGDTLHTGAPLRFLDVPTFRRNTSGRVRLQDTRSSSSTRTPAAREEGLMQLFYVTRGRREPIIGVVGALQFDVMTSRLRTEYGVEVQVEPTTYQRPMDRRSDAAAADTGRTDHRGRGPAGARCCCLRRNGSSSISSASPGDHLARRVAGCAPATR